MFGDGENGKELVHASRVERRDGDSTADTDDDSYGYVSYNGYGSGFSGSSSSNTEESNEGDAQMVRMVVGGGENGKELVHANRVERRDGDSTANYDDDGYDYYGYGGGFSGFSGFSRSGFSGSGSGLGCLTNQEAYLRNGCCAGSCATSYSSCFDCPTTPQQDPANYGGPPCFQNGACIAQEPAEVCNAPSQKRPRGTGTEYAGWCACPTGSYCRGSGCNSTTPRNLWNPDEVSMRTARDCVCSCVCSC